MKKAGFITLIFILLYHLTSNAQNKTQHTAWFSYQIYQKLNPKFNFDLNFKMRTADEYKYLKTIVLRPALDYNLNKKIVLTLGYQYFNHYFKPESLENYHLEEHGVWEQFLANTKIKSTNLTYRLRLEQRFIEQQTGYVFSERLRMQVRAIQPLKHIENSFNKGFYITVQDEVLLNIQNKELLNLHYLDQNRIGVSLGYRLNTIVDIETSYSDFNIQGKTNKNHTEVIQLSLNTRFK